MLRDFKINNLQWVQLVFLSMIHFSMDVFAGVLPVILPAIQERFSVTVSAGILLVSVLHLVCNFIQIMVGHVGENRDRPVMMYMGIAAVGFVCLLVFLPKEPFSFWLMIPLVVITALAIGIYHPESLRALHRLDRIAPSLGSSVFLNSGYLGFSAGGWIGAILITQFGFNGLLGLLILPVLSLILMAVSKFKLSVENETSSENSSGKNIASVSFIFVMMMAIPTTTVSVLLGVLVPQKISLLGLPLTFGGFSVMMFIFGTVLGTLVWSWLAHKIGEMKCAVVAMLLGVPFLFGYVFMIHQSWAVWLLFVAGSTANAAYPLLVTLARFAKGMNLGRRMGFIVGGTWGVSSLFMLVLAPVVEKFGPEPILYITPVFYLFSAIIGINVLMFYRKLKVA